MEIPFAKLSSRERYRLMTSLIVPRPIAWVSTIDALGRTNLAPYSFFNALGNSPSVIAFGPGPRRDGSLKDTERAVLETGEFVLNLVEKEQAELMHASAAPYEEGVSEIDVLEIALEPSQVVAAPRVALARVHFECRYHSTVKIEENHIIFGVLEHLHVADALVGPDGEELLLDEINAVGRMQGPGRYCSTKSQFDLGKCPKLK